MAGKSMCPIRLIVADLDGTLLNSAHEVSPLTEQAVHEAMANGVLFTVATGKTFSSTPDLIARFNIQIPLICGNGTLIYAPDGSVLHEDPIPRDLAIEAVRLAHDAGMTPVIYAGKGLLCPVWDANIDELVAHHEPVPDIVPDLELALAEEYTPVKLVIMDQDPAIVARFYKQLAAAFGGRAQTIRSGLDSVVELLPQGVTKGTALDFVLDYVNVPFPAVLALGDNCNDLDMLQRAGIGVAMAHAPQAVRDSADYVTGSNDEDGVGHAIYKYVLNTQREMG